MKKIFKDYFLWTFYLSFLLIWALKEVLFSFFIYDSAAIILSGVVKIIFWILPVILIVKAVEETSVVNYLKLRMSKKTIIVIMVISLLVTIAICLKSLLLNISVFELDFRTWLNVVILAGVTEEIMFRGFILQKLSKMYSFWKANLCTSLLFVLIHYPIWIVRELSLLQVVSVSVNILLLGIIFGIVFKKTGTLWAAIIIHSGYNLFASL